jgi:hypothetical protein
MPRAPRADARLSPADFVSSNYLNFHVAFDPRQGSSPASVTASGVDLKQDTRNAASLAVQYRAAVPREVKKRENPESEDPGFRCLGLSDRTLSQIGVLFGEPHTLDRTSFALGRRCEVARGHGEDRVAQNLTKAFQVASPAQDRGGKGAP